MVVNPKGMPYLSRSSNNWKYCICFCYCQNSRIVNDTFHLPTNFFHLIVSIEKFQSARWILFECLIEDTSKTVESNILKPCKITKNKLFLTCFDYNLQKNFRQYFLKNASIIEYF